MCVKSNPRVVLGLASICVAAAAAAQSSSVCPGGAVGYWPLDGSGTEVVNGFPGAVIGSVMFVPGVVGQAASFDGLSFIDNGPRAELSSFGGTELSFSAWVQPSQQIDLAPIVSARTGCNAGTYQLYASVFGNVYMSKVYLDASYTEFFSPLALPVGTWTHVVASSTGGVARFYINGSLAHETPDDGTRSLDTVVQNVQVGSDSCGNYIAGLLDEVALWDIALTDSQVEALFQTGLAGQARCAFDADADGVADGRDVCPDTEGAPLVDGCDCAQILAHKPGGGGQCDAGTLNVFSRRIGWAKAVPRLPA
jgi:hypothetical protein